MNKRKVLFLCTGNSCRSQMAKAIVNYRLGDQWEAVSAGISPSDYIHPKALTALSEIGIHHSGRSKHVDEFKDDAFDLVVTLCDDAEENCPVWLGKGLPAHRGIFDPTKSNNIDDFRQARDLIEREIINILVNYQGDSL
jgi:arsenate reductase